MTAAITKAAKPTFNGLKHYKHSPPHGYRT